VQLIVKIQVGHRLTMLELHQKKAIIKQQQHCSSQLYSRRELLHNTVCLISITVQSNTVGHNDVAQLSTTALSDLNRF